VLDQWAKRSFDANGNVDRRVTPYEYDRGRDFILARY
jgi:hypothetical protein